MFRYSVVVVVGLLGGFPAFAQASMLPAPLEPAGKGQLQCYSPDTTRKTCQSMASYSVGSDGSIVNVAHVLLPMSPPVVMETMSHVAIREGEFCGFVLGADLDRARFVSGGQELSPDITANYRLRVRMLYQATLEREVCTTYLPDADGFRTSITVDGVPQPRAQMRVIWVSPSDGYRVAR